MWSSFNCPHKNLIYRPSNIDSELALNKWVQARLRCLQFGGLHILFLLSTANVPGGSKNKKNVYSNYENKKITTLSSVA